MYEKRKDCPEVERIIWDAVVKDFGEFAGVRPLDVPELWGLAKACADQIAMIEYDKRKKELLEND